MPLGGSEGSPRKPSIPNPLAHRLTVRALLAQHSMKDRQQASRGGDLRRIWPFSVTQALVVGTQFGIALHRGSDRLNHRPAEPLVTLLRQPPVKDLASRGVNRRHEP